jgi:4a-hydroxytetrahydrobiopterin dehydratase
MEKLKDDQLDGVLNKHPRWAVREGKLVREWTFPDFVEAMTFVNKVAQLAESAGHHPDIDIRYNKVTLGLVSHDADGITAKDADLAGKLDLVSGE